MPTEYGILNGMKIEEAKVGARVQSNVDFANVPKDTRGLIDQDYGTGVFVAWDLEDNPLTKSYVEYVETTGLIPKRRAFVMNGGTWPLRDGFNKEKELQFLDLIKPALERE